MEKKRDAQGKRESAGQIRGNSDEKRKKTLDKKPESINNLAGRKRTATSGKGRKR